MWQVKESRRIEEEDGKEENGVWLAAEARRGVSILVVLMLVHYISVGDVTSTHPLKTD